MSAMTIVMLALFALFAVAGVPLLLMIAKTVARRQDEGLEGVAQRLFGPGRYEIRRSGGAIPTGRFVLVGRTAVGDIHIVDNPIDPACTLLILPLQEPAGLYIGRHRVWLSRYSSPRKPRVIEPTGKPEFDAVFEIGALDAARLGRVTGSSAVIDCVLRLGEVVDALMELGSSDLAPTLRQYFPIEPEHFLYAYLTGSVATLDPGHVAQIARTLQMLADHSTGRWSTRRG